MISKLAAIFLGIALLRIFKGVLIFVLGAYASSVPNLNHKVDRDKDTYLKSQQKLDERRTRAMGFGFNIHPIFNVLYVAWIVMALVLF